jgi:hypothetical protein
VAYALQHELDGCSLFLAQRTRGPLEALAIASAFACLFAAQGRPRGMLNGQFILLRRAAFESVRGFEAVRHEVLEDVALGQRLLEAGCRVPLLRGEALGSVQMYQSLEQMWHGLTRLGAGALAQAKWRALLMVFMAAQLAGVALLLALAGALPPVRPLLLLGWSTSALILLSWAGRAGRLAAALAAPLGGALIVLAGTTGLLRRLVGWGWNWRGRTV